MHDKASQCLSVLGTCSILEFFLTGLEFIEIHRETVVIVQKIAVFEKKGGQKDQADIKQIYFVLI
jgi:hypothetical protein